MKVSWVEPSDRLIVEYGLLTVAIAVCGGQAAAHAPLQADLVAVSGANVYSVKPLAFVRTVTPPTLAVFRPAAAAPAEPEAAELPPAGELLPAAGELLDELHAASAARPAATAGTTSNARRRRLGTFNLSCDVIMPFFRFFLSTLLSTFLHS
jgi:hypothetical protein